MMELDYSGVESCNPAGARRLGHPGRQGWQGAPKLQLDGVNWTLQFAATILEFPERDLRDLMRILDIKPAGTLNMRDFRSQGRIPRAYPANVLINVTETVRDLKGAAGGQRVQS